MAVNTGYRVWTISICLLVFLPLVGCEKSPLYGMIGSVKSIVVSAYPPNSTIRRTVEALGNFLERPAVKDIGERGMEAYMDSNNHTVNAECWSHMMMTYHALLAQQDWALRMIDAIGKPSSGLKDLHIKWLGSYEECINIEAPAHTNQTTKAVLTSPFKGKYCRAMFVVGGDPNQPYMVAALTVGLCLPSTCSDVDAQAFASTLMELVPVNITGMPTPTAICQEEHLDYTTKAIAALTVCALLGAVIVIATIYDVIVNCFLAAKGGKVEPLTSEDRPSEKGAVSPNGAVPMRTFNPTKFGIPTNVHTNTVYADILTVDDTEKDADDQTVDDTEKGIDVQTVDDTEKGADVQTGDIDPGAKGKMKGNRHAILGKILVSFSLYTNLGKIMNTSQPAGTLTAVHGIRFISMSWVILGHAFSTSLMDYEQHISKLIPELFNRITFHAIGNATFAVDTFFLLSGVLVAYLSLKELKKVKGVRHFNWLMYYFHRYWRLTPPYMLVLMVYVTTLKYWSSGPQWPQNGISKDECKDTWWWNMLYINNLIDPAKECMGWGWYLANDMQFYVISPLMLIPLFYSRILGTISCFLFVLTQMVTSGVITWNNELSSNLFFSQKKEQYEQLYVKPWYRVGVYAVGMFTGYLLYLSNCKLKMPKTVRIIGWQLATAGALLVLYGLWNPDGWEPNLTRTATTVYNATSRVVWSLCVAWVILNCATGQGGAVNTFLSWPAFIPLSRLSYCAYLVHPLVQVCYLYSKRTLVYYTDMEMAFMFAGNMVFAYAAALLTSLAFEAPMMGLEKAILKRGKRS